MFCNGYTTATGQSSCCQTTLGNWQIVGLNENFAKMVSKSLKLKCSLLLVFLLGITVGYRGKKNL
jgi:hypothetical protein